MIDRSSTLNTDTTDSASCSEGTIGLPTVSATGFTFDLVPLHKGCRWFVRHGATTSFDRGFVSKSEADAWIKSLGYLVDWRAGFAFQLKGDSQILVVVDRAGNEAKI